MENSNIYDNFLDSLLNSNMTKALEISNKFIKNKNDIEKFWIEIILPALYDIGKLWEESKISVGEEHVATSICQRVMSEHCDTIYNNIGKRGKVLVTLAPNELHQVGAMMLSDVLEIHGFDTYFIKSKSSIDKIIDLIEDEDINDIIISSTIEENIDNTKILIKNLRDKISSKNINIFVGGQAYKNIENIIERTDANYYIKDITTLINTLDRINKNA
jgi:methanogenic corrinoid protein MtbC1